MREADNHGAGPDKNDRELGREGGREWGEKKGGDRAS